LSIINNSVAPLRVLVLTPTRELAAQVHENVREYSKYVDIKIWF
jgi:ATP-dependent RNA helicase RhlE